MEITMNDILYAVLTIVAPMALKLLWQYVDTKTANSKYSDAVNSVFDAVLYTNQVFVDELKEKGCFDAEAQAAAFTKAKDTALELMEEGTRRWLERTFDSVDAWLEVHIESAVKSVKEAA